MLCSDFSLPAVRNSRSVVPGDGIERLQCLTACDPTALGADTDGDQKFILCSFPIQRSTQEDFHVKEALSQLLHVLSRASI